MKSPDKILFLINILPNQYTLSPTTFINQNSGRICTVSSVAFARSNNKLKSKRYGEVVPAGGVDQRRSGCEGHRGLEKYLETTIE